jgi:deoxyribose-phosphate aldolase
MKNVRNMTISNTVKEEVVMSNVREENIKELGKHFELSVVSLLSDDELVAAAKKSVEYNMRAVYVPAFQLNIVKEAIKGSDLLLGGAVSFPLGVDSPKAKVTAAQELVDAGVDCIDFVMNHWALRNGMPEIVEEEVKMLREALPDKELKMILEVCTLNDEEIKTAVRIAGENNIDFVKSSTGQYQGPSMEQVCLMVDEAKKYGLRTKVAGVKLPRAQNAYAFLKAGIEVIGTQQAFNILDGIDLLRDRDVM